MLLSFSSFCGFAQVHHGMRAKCTKRNDHRSWPSTDGVKNERLRASVVPGSHVHARRCTRACKFTAAASVCVLVFSTTPQNDTKFIQFALVTFLPLFPLFLSVKLTFITSDGGAEYRNDAWSYYAWWENVYAFFWREIKNREGRFMISLVCGVDDNLFK